MEVTLGRTCNHACAFCTATAKPWERCDGKWRQQLRECVGTVRVLGGEPTAHTEYVDILEALALRENPIELYTNSDAFSDMRFVEHTLRRVSASRLQVVTMLHSHRAYLHDQSTHSAGSFGRSMQGLRNLAAVSVGIQLRHPLLRWNLAALGDFLHFVDAQFLQSVPLQLVGVRGETPRDVGSYLEAALSQSKRAVRVTNLPLCAMEARFRRAFERDDASCGLETTSPENGVCARCALYAQCPGANWPDGVYPQEEERENDGAIA